MPFGSALALRTKLPTAHRMVRAFLRTSMLGLVLVCLPAQAQQDAAAEALFRSAQEAAKKGDWVTACDRFAESNRLDEAPGTILNLARCHEELGHQASAWKYYQEAAQKLPVGDRRAQFARARAAEIEPGVPKIRFLPPEGAQVSYSLKVNGTAYSEAMLDVDLPFDPGAVTIVVQAPGHRDRTTRLTIEAGENLTYPVELGASLPREADRHAVGRVQSDAQATRKTNPWPIVAFSVGGVGAATAVFGGVWSAIELPTARDEAHCRDGACDHIGAAASRRGRVAVVLVGVGSAVAVAGFSLGTYFILHDSRADDTSRVDSSAAGSGWRLAPAVSVAPGGAMLSLTVTPLSGLGRL